MITKKLELVRRFQVKFPKSHVCGSLSLYIRGFDLDRKLNDIDMIVTENLTSKFSKKTTVSLDFDYSLDIEGEKMEFRVDPIQEFEVVEYNGHKYNCSLLDVVLSLKQLYADKGISKHHNDLKLIEQQSLKNLF